MSERRLNNKDRLLALLIDHREHGQHECLSVGGFRYGARIFDLRRDGFDIETIRLGDDEFSYRLRVARPEQTDLLEVKG